jgi:hypothetical protein
MYLNPPDGFAGAYLTCNSLNAADATLGFDPCNRILFGVTGDGIYGVGIDTSQQLINYMAPYGHLFSASSVIDTVGTETVFIGATGMTVTGNLAVRVFGLAGGNIFAENDLDVSGNITVDGTINGQPYPPPSDYRIKKDVEPLNSTYTVDQLRPVSYYNMLANKNDVGLIAHELQEVYPFMVNGIKDGPKNQSVNYTSLIGILIKEIQRLKERVDILEKNN